MVKYQNKLKTHTEIIKTHGFSTGCYKGVGKCSVHAGHHSVARTAIPDWGRGLRGLRD